MFIKLKNDDTAEKRKLILDSIKEELATSRFFARVMLENHSKWKQVIHIEMVRKKVKSEYCGQHPCECVVTPFRENKHRRSFYLEGADWVGFNDMLNHILDKLHISADVWSYNREAGSGRFMIRKGTKRRVAYLSQAIFNGYVEFNHWELGEDKDYEDYCGKDAPPSEYPEGTPGLATWKNETKEEVRVC